MAYHLSSGKRRKIVKRLKEGASVSQVAREFKISRPTIYKWLKSKTYKTKTRRVFKQKKGASPEQEKMVRWALDKNPSASKYELSKIIRAKWGDKGLDPTGVYKVLRRLGLNKVEARIALSGRTYHLSPELRAAITKRIIEEQIPINRAAKLYGVSRPTIYKWINEYRKASDKKRFGFETKRETQDRYFQQSTPEQVEAVKWVVINNPEASKYKISEIISKAFPQKALGPTGVYKVLQKMSLTLPQARIAYAQAHQVDVHAARPAFIDRVRYVLEQFVPTLAPAPPPSIATILSFLRTFSITSIISSATVYSLVWWIDYLASLVTNQAIGLVFATIALFMGSLFFIYSLKYYLTLALVLSFSQSETTKNIQQRTKGKGLLSWLLGGEGSDLNGKAESRSAAGLTPDLENIVLEREPYVSIHIPFYNEERVVERAIAASTNFDYPNYEVILCDDSTDETTDIIRKYQGSFGKLRTSRGDGYTLTECEVRPGVILKHLHRTTRSGFKGGALRLALTLVDPRTEFISVFDADFVPYPDTLELFLKYFQATAGTLDFQSKNNELGIKNKGNNNHNSSFMLHDSRSNIAAVQGYQWHVLNKSENWITRGVRSEYAGSYVIERSGIEIYSGLKQISGAVYMIRRDVLEEVGWETSITEDFQLTLKLYEKGYKVVYTPYIQAPAECVSTLKRLIRQRMRWAEGHSNNIRKMFVKLLIGKWVDSNVVNDQSTPNPKTQTLKPNKVFIPSPLTVPEKLEFLYLSPYYLQAFFFLVGTISWLISETVFPGQLPFWTSLWGWSLVLTNMISLPLMNAVGLFLEESEERDYQGLISFVALSYIVVPFQAYSSIKGLIQKEEGPWFRTPKTGHITDVFQRGRFYRFISGILPGRSAQLAMHQASFLPNLNQYLAMSTANSQFNSFELKPNKARWIGKLVVVILLITSTILLSLAPGISSMNVAEAKGFGMIAGPGVDKKESIKKEEKMEKADVSKQQDLSWGVLAINTNKSTYVLGEKANISIALLDEKGNMDCDADIYLDIKGPDDKTTNLSTKEGTITKSTTCNKKSKVLVPDIETSFIPENSGSYQMVLSSLTKNGLWMIEDKFEVVDSRPYDIERDSVTRIYPPETYSTTLKIKANQDYQGEVIEVVPDSFEVQAENATIKSKTPNVKQISWQVDWIAGQTYELTYEYDAPDTSPDFHLLGPLVIGDYQEVRQWQIASDNPGVGDIGIWRDSAGSQIPGTTFGAMNFATQQRNDGAYTFTGSNNLNLDEAGNYLLIATIKYVDTSNGRVNYEGRFAYTGSGDFVTQYGSGYSRNTANQTAWARVVGLVWGAAVNDDVQLEMRTDTDAPTGGSVIDASHFQVVRLHDSAAVGLYTDTSDVGGYGTTWADAPFNNNVLENDTSVIQKQAGNTDIRLKKDATTFLVGYGLAFSTGGSRTQRVTKVVAGSTDIEQSFSYAFQRNTSNEYMDPNGLFLYRNSGTSTDLSVQAELGYADVAGSAVRRTSTSGMFVVELPSSAEVFISHDSTAVQDVGGTAGDFNIMRDVNYNDSAAFTKVDNTAMNSEKAMDVLLMAQVLVEETVEANVRLTSGARFEIQTADQTLGEHGNYLRGLQGSMDTYDFAYTPSGMYTVSSGDDVQVEWFDAGDNGSTPLTQVDAVGFGALNLDSLAGTTSTSADATGWSWQRKTFKDTTNSNYWRAFYDGAEIDIEYSSDGTAWTPITSISQNTNDFSFWYRTGDTYVYICYDNADDIEVMRGTLGASNITWGSSGIALNGTGASDTYGYCNIARDSSGYLWVVGRHYDSTNYEIEVADTTAADPATPSFNASSSLSATSSTDTNTYGVMTPLGSQDMYVTWKRGTAIEGCFWDDTGGQWENTGGSGGSVCSAGSNVDSIDTGITGLDDNISALSDDINYDVHLAYIEDDTTDTVSYNRWDNGSGTNGTWQTEITLDTSDTDTYVSISYDELTEDLYAVYIDTSNNYIKYRQCDVTTDATDCSTVGNWQTEQDWKTTGTNTNITSNYGGNGEIFALWTQGSGSPYTIDWDTIIVPEHLWLFFFPAPFFPLLLRRRKAKRKLLVLKR